MTDKFNELIYDAAKESQARFRWFLLATTLLSSLLVTHMYLELYGTLEPQLKNTIKEDVILAAKLRKFSDCQQTDVKEVRPGKPAPVKTEKKTPASQSFALAKVSNNIQAIDNPKIEPEYFHGRLQMLEKEQEEVIEKLVESLKCDDLKKEWDRNGESVEEAKERYASEKVAYLRSYNIFHDYKLHNRSLPFLNLEMDANDYVPVMAILLAIMSAAVWMSVSSMAAAMEKLASTGGTDMIEALKYRMTFSFPDARGDISCVSNTLLFLAIWLPVGALAASFGLDLWSVLSAQKGALPDSELMAIRWVCLGICLFCVFTFARLSAQASARLKKIAYPWPSTRASDV